MTESTVAGVPDGQMVTVNELVARNIIAAVPALQKVEDQNGLIVAILNATENEVDMVGKHMQLGLGDLQEQTRAELVKIRVGFRWALMYPYTAASLVSIVLGIGFLIGRHFA